MNLLEDSAAGDLTTEIAIAVLRWDKQRAKAGLDGPVDLAIYDKLLGGAIELRLFEYDVMERITRKLTDRLLVGELSDPVDIVALLKNLSPENLPDCLDVFRDRLIERLYQPSRRGSDRDDPLDLLVPLQALTRAELKRVDDVLAGLVPPRRRGNPRKSLLYLDYDQLEFWRRVTEYSHQKMKLGKALAVVARENGDRESPLNSLRTSYRRVRQLFRARLRLPKLP